MSRDAPLEMWTLYEHPLDYPEGYVARLWCVTTDGGAQASETAFYGETRGDVDEFFAERYPELFFVPRAENDEPQILGVWM